MTWDRFTEVWLFVMAVVVTTGSAVVLAVPFAWLSSRLSRWFRERSR